MFSRNNRVPLKKELVRIKSNSRLYDTSCFGLLVSFHNSPENQEDFTKVGFIVSKKVDKRSVIRHEVKRKLASAISSFIPRLPKNLDLVFLAKQSTITCTPEKLTEETNEVLQRAGLLK